ncbi:MAG: carboxypeptidase-like regulatory domain-containing protein [Sphingobacteriaceae bacterium]
MKQILLLCLIFITQLAVNGQSTFSISGIVKNSQGVAVPLATVFIDGSEKATSTNEQGEFKFSNLKPGTYQLVVNMLSYFSVKQNVILQKEPAVLIISLTEKQIALAEVVIGDRSNRDEYLNIFMKNFLGESKNAKGCKILNTDKLYFTNREQDGILEAQSDDFLIIENKRLGYRIKYLLRQFKYNRFTTTTIYDGEVIFENLTGNEKITVQWIKNRKETYKGSFMHYLRSVYNNSTREEGFITYEVENATDPLLLNPVPLNIEAYVATIDKDFIGLSCRRRLYIRFDPAKKILNRNADKKDDFNETMAKDGSLMRLFLETAVIDHKGSYVDYRSFFIQGFWGRKRIGDQLPFEYTETN